MILHRYNYSLQLRSVFVRCVFLYLSCTGAAPESCIILRDQGDAYLTKAFAGSRNSQGSASPTPQTSAFFMNRKKAAPLSSKLPLPSESVADSLGDRQTNLMRVRPGLTAAPQTILTDFKLRPTPYGLEIQLPLSRIRGRLMTAINGADSAESTGLTLFAVVGMTLFVGGSVVLTGSAVVGVVVAVALPALFWLAALPEKPASAREVTLRLVNAPNGRTLLSMSSAPNNNHSKDVIYFSNLPVRLVSAKTTLRGGQVSFTVYADNPRGNQICIVGSRQEVRWLHARIVQWGRGSSSSMPSV